MKARFLYYVAGLCCLWLVGACADDKGNYDYTELNDLSIRFEDNYAAISRENFTIVPEVDAKVFNPDDYTYEWKAYATTNTGQEPVVLGTALKLDGELDLLQGTYRLVLKITEKSTGLYYLETASLKVDTPTSLGWLVLGSDNGRVRLDMVSHIKTVDNVYYDLLKHTELADWQNPYQLVCDPKMAEPFYLLTGSGATRLSNNEFQWNESYLIKNEFGSGQYNGTVRHLAAQFPGKLIVDANGRVYYCNTLSGDGLFGTVRNNGFYVSPLVGYNALASQFVPSFMMWDRNNRRFVICTQEFSSLYLDNLKDIPMSDLVKNGFPTVNEELFAWPVRSDKLEMLHLENTRYDKNKSENGTTYALLAKDTKRFLYGIILGELYSFVEPKYGQAYEKAYYVDLSACTDIVSATHFAFSSLKTFMYYTVANKLYRVNFANENPVAELQFTLPEGEDITFLKFYLCTQEDAEHRTYDLIVGSKKAGSTESTLRIYEGFDSEGNFHNAEPIEQYGGFADIVDVIYRENVVYQQ